MQLAAGSCWLVLVSHPLSFLHTCHWRFRSIALLLVKLLPCLADLSPARLPKYHENILICMQSGYQILDCEHPFAGGGGGGGSGASGTADSGTMHALTIQDSVTKLLWQLPCGQK